MLCAVDALAKFHMRNDGHSQLISIRTENLTGPDASERSARSLRAKFRTSE